MSSKNELKKLSKDELLDEYFRFANEGSRDLRPELSIKYASQAGIYLTEIQRRQNKLSNFIMVACTIAITIMTAVILWATLISAGIMG